MDYYNVTVGPTPYYYFTNTVRMILPSGARHALNANAGGMVRITGDSYWLDGNLRTIVRAYAEKFPGFLFSDFSEILLRMQGLISIDDFSILMNEHF